MKRIPWVLLFIAFTIISCTSPENDDLIGHILQTSNDTIIKKVLSNKENHEIQILYTRISRNEDSLPSFTEYQYQLDADQYFYPASTVKLPLAILALEKIRELQLKGVNITPESPFEIIDENGIVLEKNDTTHPAQHLTIAHLIKKIFLVSDNAAYNHLFDLIGRDSINVALRKRGIEDVQILHKFDYSNSNHKTPRFIFFSPDEDTVYQQKPILSKASIANYHLKGRFKGNGFMQRDTINEGPMDFSHKNYISLNALNEIVKRIIFPESYSENEQFKLLYEDYEFLRHWMSRVPTEVEIPYYDRDDYYDSYSKFLMYGDQKGQMSETLRIYNKVGQAYGTTTDVAYIKDSSGIEFLLAATILTNENGIFNDGEYEYDQVGIPFLAALGRAIYQFERQHFIENK